MSKTKIQRMRNLSEVFMVTVCEGEGTEEDICREVKYFYDKDLEFIGKLDSHLTEDLLLEETLSTKHKVKKLLEDAINSISPANGRYCLDLALKELDKI